MKISKSKITKEYRDILALYRSDIKTLDQDERIEAIGLAKSYYNYLVSHDIAYGKLALDVIENKGQFGQIANIHLKHQSIFEGISPELITIVREQIIIRLAYKDTKMRSQTSYQQNDPCYKLIEDYHEEVFNQHTTIYAWGGLAMKELVGSGSWMRAYEQNKTIVDCIGDVLKSEMMKPHKSDYSVERMLQSARHSFNIFVSHIDSRFLPIVTTASKEEASQIWQIDGSRIIEIVEDKSMFESMVESKRFKLLASNKFYPKEEIPDNSFNGFESENDDSCEFFGANKSINNQMKQLFSNKEKLQEYQEESLNEALNDLELAESIVPNIYKYSVESMNANKEFMEQLMGKANSSEILEKIERTEEEMSELEPNIKGLNESLKTSHNYKNEMKAETPSIDWLTLLSDSTKYIETMNSSSEMQDFMNSLSGAHKFFDNDDV